MGCGHSSGRPHVVGTAAGDYEHPSRSHSSVALGEESLKNDVWEEELAEGNEPKLSEVLTSRLGRSQV